VAESNNVMLAVSSNEAAHKIKHVLTRAGYHVPEICISGNEAIRRVRQTPPDILLINFEMHDLNGLEVAKIIGDENLCSVVLMVGGAQRGYAIEAIAEHDITLLAKPLNKLVLLNTLDIVFQARTRMVNLGRKLEKVKEDLENRKIIEKAKGVLIKTKYISEGEAYRRIQKMSMDNRVSMKEVAMRICEYAKKR
jgi:two-component system, response regulator PdtaR